MSYVVLASLSCRSMPKHTWDENRNSLHNHPAPARSTRNKIDAHRRTIPAWRRVIRSLCHCHSMRPSNQIYLSNQSTYSSIYSSLLFSPSFHSMRGLSALYCLTIAYTRRVKKYYMQKLSSRVHCRLSSTSFPRPPCPLKESHKFLLDKLSSGGEEKERKESGEKLLKCFRTTSKLWTEMRLNSRVEWAEQQRQLDETMVPMNSAVGALLLLGLRFKCVDSRLVRLAEELDCSSREQESVRSWGKFIVHLILN